MRLGLGFTGPRISRGRVRGRCLYGLGLSHVRGRGCPSRHVCGFGAESGAMADTMTPIRFVQKWARAELSERAASQEHFIDLCRMLGQPTPAEHDATGAEYTFEKGAAVLGGASRGSKGEYGFADVWWRGKFAWEYKRKGKYRDLAEAYRQLCQYREALDNPPLLIVSDIARTEIHTNFTGTAKQVHAVALERIAEPEALDLLRRVFTDPGSFRPQTTAVNVTEVVAGQFASLSSQLAAQGHHPHTVAHFLMRCMFCLFAEDIGLLPGKVFERLLQSLLKSPARSAEALSSLFAQMRTGGMFGPDEIPHFNGGLFDEAPALPLGESEIRSLLAAATADWASVEPAIFGTRECVGFRDGLRGVSGFAGKDGQRDDWARSGWPVMLSS